ncbi:MAG: hypothetical protein JW940_18585 [Polyangiaceae bacterium]|nr:hypothetical protein [Polyangiaceae bacterium]
MPNNPMRTALTLDIVVENLTGTGEHKGTPLTQVGRSTTAGQTSAARHGHL